MKATNTKVARGHKPPSHPFRAAAFALVTSKPFEYTVMGVIAANVLGMALDYHRIDQKLQRRGISPRGSSCVTNVGYGLIPIATLDRIIPANATSIGLVTQHDPDCE